MVATMASSMVMLEAAGEVGHAHAIASDFSDFSDFSAFSALSVTLSASSSAKAVGLALMVSRTEQYEFGGMFGQYGTTKELLAMARAALAKAGIT